VAHCPRSHAYFGHRRFPYEELAAAGVNVCLGTDSLASVPPRGGRKPELNMFDEMWVFADAHPGAAPEAIVEMATRNGARALGWLGLAGELSPGSRADIVAIPFTGRMEESAEAIVHHAGEVTFSMIDGERLPEPAPGAGREKAKSAQRGQPQPKRIEPRITRISRIGNLFEMINDKRRTLLHYEKRRFFTNCP
jgi:cytosine/adenosine deaminase-related metal-dependent hydrolase